MKPNGMANINRIINNAYIILMVISFSVVIMEVIVRHIKLNMYIYLLAFFMGWLVLRSFFAGGQTGSLLEIAMRFGGISVLIQLYSKQVSTLIRGFFINFEAIIYLNFICLLLYPHGMYVSSQTGNWNNWLLGYDNHWFIVYFGACFILFTYSYIFNCITRPFLLFCIIHISSFIVMSGAIIVGLLLIDFFWIFKIYKSPLFTYRTIWIVAIIVNAMFIFIGGSGIISFIIYSVLQKSSATLLSRQRIWEKTILSIKDNLLFGVGKPQTIDRIAFYNNRHASNAHNFLLEIVFEGGMVALLLFYFMVRFVGKRLKNHSDNPITGFLLLALMACLVTGSIDSFLEDRGYMFFALLAFASNIEMFSGIAMNSSNGQ